ncbi:hypothetical protein HHE03_03370 [Helicobacter heilmannii]|nr:hypothetical protein HHE03_03370 [Helicobacter heilmannii]
MCASVPYRPDFECYKAHYSGLHFGASNPSLDRFRAIKGLYIRGVR